MRAQFMLMLDMLRGRPKSRPTQHGRQLSVTQPRSLAAAVVTRMRRKPDGKDLNWGCRVGVRMTRRSDLG